MASVLHGSARTTPRLRAEFQASKESSRALAARYGLNAKTVRKWRKRTTTADALMGPKKPKSTVLTPAEEAIVVAFRQKTIAGNRGFATPLEKRQQRCATPSRRACLRARVD